MVRMLDEDEEEIWGGNLGVGGSLPAIQILLT